MRFEILDHWQRVLYFGRFWIDPFWWLNQSQCGATEKTMMIKNTLSYNASNPQNVCCFVHTILSHELKSQFLLPSNCHQIVSWEHQTKFLFGCHCLLQFQHKLNFRFKNSFYRNVGSTGPYLQKGQRAQLLTINRLITFRDKWRPRRHRPNKPRMKLCPGLISCQGQGWKWIDHGLWSVAPV